MMPKKKLERNWKRKKRNVLIDDGYLFSVDAGLAAKWQIIKSGQYIIL